MSLKQLDFCSGIRHPEELSLCRPLTSEHLKRNYPRGLGCTPRQRSKEPTAGINLSQNNNNKSDGFLTPDTSGSAGTPLNTSWNDGRNYSPSTAMFNGNSSFLNYSGDSSISATDLPLAHSPRTPNEEARHGVLRPKSLTERARLNSGWLDSSLSIMEQDIREFDTLLLRFKFYSFYDLNPKYDAVRINQIYEQAKWALLAEEIDCTEEEMMLFAALQVQVNLQANHPQPDIYHDDEDVETALTDLQVTLEGTLISKGKSNITNVPELSDYLSFMKPKRFTLKGFKRYYIVLRDTYLNLYKSKDSESNMSISLKGCEVTPDVNLSHGKYGIRLEVPNHEGMTEYWIRCSSEEQYAKWMAACRLAAKGKTMADSSYELEVKSIQDFLSMQKPAPAAVISPSQIDINPDDMVAPRFIRKLKSQKIIQRILEAHANVKDLNLMEAKLSYIKAWQALPEFGMSLFVVRFDNGRRDELLGIAFNRLMRMDLSTGDHIKTWRYNTMKVWNVNWEVRQVRVQFEEENVAFSCLSADCKVVHEFIGGYIFLSMRSKDQNQTLNEDLFHKLTGGWV
ncbi:Unc-112-related protein [Araneus ventricosus]|uniref:Unc-112-related protein n=1 Tax=Araneus ventricosus TaxID=182803 RepID=A0A4Y2IXP8_ARAVE|nr:Unc-112-related protein [Araneus ventricosus]